MNIHQIINARSWATTRHCREMFGMPIEPEELALVTIALKAKRYTREYLSRPQYYCPDCSHEYRRAIYHRDAPTPHDRLSRYKRSTLIKISDINIIETEYPYYQ